MLASRSQGGRVCTALSVACALLLPAHLRAQTLNGRVLEDGRNTPVPGATITLLDRDGHRRAETVSDSAGRFRLVPPEAGEYLVEAAVLGYETTRSPLLALKTEGAVPLDLLMTPLPIGLEGLNVSVEAEAEELLRNYGQTPASLGDRWISHADIEKMPLPIGPLEAIRARHIAGVWVQECRSIVMCGLCVRFRGGGCALTILNGMHISEVDAQAINPYDLEAIVLLGPTEAATFFGTQGGSGAVLMWTRQGGS